MSNPKIKSRAATDWAIGKINDILNRKPGEPTELGSHIVLDLFYKLEVPDHEVPQRIADAINKEGRTMIDRGVKLMALVHEFRAKFKLPIPFDEDFVDRYPELDRTAKKIMDLFRYEDRLTTGIVNDTLVHAKRPTIRRKLEELTKAGYIHQEGKGKGTYYTINKEKP